METSYVPVTRERVERLLVKALREKGRLNVQEARDTFATVIHSASDWPLLRTTVYWMKGRGMVRICEDDATYLEIVPGKYKDFSTDEPTEIEGSGDQA